MQVKNILFRKGLSFEEYQQLDGYSYSSLKNRNIQPTEKMRLGTSVHNFILEPDKYDHSNRDLVLPIANTLLREIGNLIDHMDSELSVQADFEYEGFIFPYRGRVDLVRCGKIVIDLKISEIPLNRSVPFFGYAEQVTGYCLATGSDHGMIIRVCPKTHKVEKTMIRKNISWWERQVLQKGIPSFINN